MTITSWHRRDTKTIQGLVNEMGTNSQQRKKRSPEPTQKEKTDHFAPRTCQSHKMAGEAENNTGYMLNITRDIEERI